MIVVENVCKSYYQAGACIQVLKNLSFNVEKSKTLAITGPSGSGKTTLLSILAGLEQPDQGSVILNHQSVHKMNESQLTHFRTRNVGIVFQQYHLLPHLTALENVSLPLEINGEKNFIEKAKEQLEKVKLSHRLNHLPSQLSGGECQRTAIARACVHQPKILLADEPSGNLDSKSSQIAMDILFSLVRENQMTMILVTHNLNLAKLCGSQLSLEKHLFKAG